MTGITAETLFPDVISHLGQALAHEVGVFTQADQPVGFFFNHLNGGQERRAGGGGKRGAEDKSSRRVFEKINQFSRSRRKSSDSAQPFA